VPRAPRGSGAPPPAGRAILLPHLVLPGAEQMALDAALLRWAAAAPDRFVARTYDWARPTLSLGRAEPFPEGWDEGALAAAGVDVVRRPTGGDAVLHDEEVTFAVAASVPGPWAARPRAFSLLVAESLAEALRGLGLAAGVVAPGEEVMPAAPPGARPCFARAAAGEVRVEALKAAGIASRFTRGAALSHASLPLTARHRDVARFRKDAAPALAGIAAHARSIGEALGRAPSPEAVRAGLLGALVRRFGVAAVPGALEEIAEAAPSR
jgi:lipoyl(octanoyl) transferase